MRNKPENARSQIIVPTSQQQQPQQSEGKMSQPHLKGSDWGHNHYKKVLEEQASHNVYYAEGERPQEDHYQTASTQQPRPEWQDIPIGPVPKKKQPYNRGPNQFSPTKHSQSQIQIRKAQLTAALGQGPAKRTPEQQHYLQPKLNDANQQYAASRSQLNLKGRSALLD